MIILTVNHHTQQIRDNVIHAYLKFTQVLYDKSFILESIKDKENKSNDTILNTFIVLLSGGYSLGSIGTNFLFRYFAFQYEFWNELEITPRFKNRLPLSWIIGEKAFERWLDNPYRDLTKALGVMKSFGITHTLIENQTKDNLSVIEINVSEENTKKTFFNEERGYVLCLEATTLFNDRSASCCQCKFNEQCKLTLQVNYPKIFITRGYKPQRSSDRVRRVA